MVLLEAGWLERALYASDLVNGNQKGGPVKRIRGKTERSINRKGQRQLLRLMA